jgi:hypothetical protein
MSTSDHFAIECADGTTLTLYVQTTLRAETWRQLRQVVDQFPATVRVLRLQLMGDVWRELPAAQATSSDTGARYAKAPCT